MYDFDVEGGESVRQVFDRMKAAVAAIAAENHGRTIAVVSHGCAIRTYLCHAMGVPLEQLKDVGWSDNTAVSLVEYDDSLQPRIIFRNSNDHLTDELSTLSHSAWCKDELSENR